jgi:hypothetical protein
MSNWISVKDRLPSLLNDYLVFANGAIKIMTWDESWGQFIEYDGPLNHEDVTYWMPLPEPPNQ